MIFLGIDCGTQSTKTIALDWESRRILASAQQSYDFVAGLPPGAMEQNPQDWTDAVFFQLAGSFWRSQRILGAVYPGRIVFPTRAVRALSPPK